MWLGFRTFWVSFIFLVYAFIGNAQDANGLVYNLKHNWVQYDENAKSFLPVIAHKSGNSISFTLDGNQFTNQILYIQNSSNVSLFYQKTLLISFNVGGHKLDIDSLVNHLEVKSPLLTIYGSKLKENIQTLVINDSFTPQEEVYFKSKFRNTNFTSYFIFALIVLFIGLIIIKMKVPDLFSQYNALQRALNPQTIDELIYKGRFFGNSGIEMVLWISFGSGFILNFLVNKLDINFMIFLALKNGSVSFYTINWITLSIGFLCLLLFRYLLVYSMSVIFDMLPSKNIHFASHLRLTYFMLLIMLVLSTLDYFSLFSISRTSFIGIVFGLLFVIIFFIGLRLAFIIKHTFVQLFLYLCGTEIFLFVFVYKLVVE